jgi:diguanylate cyclase (GGDEF)-like protein
LFDHAGQRQGARGVCRDITLERVAENDLARHKAREQVVDFVVDAIRNEAKPANMLTTAVTSLGRAMTVTSCAVYQVNAPGKLTRAARYGALPNGRRLAAALKRSQSKTGIVAEQIPGYEILILSTHYRGHANGAMLLCRDSNAATWSDEDRLLLRAVSGQLGIALQQIADQQELMRLSRTDSLTGLLNRRAFMDELTGAIERTRRNGESSAVLYLDLDNFKTVNDLYGHAEGDNVLKQIAHILRSSTRRYDYVARLGGDEFAIWIENIDKKSLRRRIAAIIASSGEIFANKGTAEAPLGLSVGAALHQLGSRETPEQILKRADAAMYQGKNSKTKNVVFAPAPLRD